MTKNDLVKQVLLTMSYYPPPAIALAVNTIFTAMSEALKQNERIEIRGFGSFSVKSRATRRMLNPKSGKTYQVPPRKIIYFKASPEIQRMINERS